MDSVEIALQTTLGFEVNVDIEAIENYNGVYTASNCPRPSIMAADGRNANMWVFLAYENDTSGHVGSGSGYSTCGSNGWSWNGVYEANSNSDTTLVNVRLCHYGRFQSCLFKAKIGFFNSLKPIKESKKLLNPAKVS